MSSSISISLAVIIFAFFSLIRYGWGIKTRLSWLFAVNMVTFFCFWYDKRMAIMGGYRVSEMLLLELSIAGGSPGAFVAMSFFRHKINKTSFKRKLYLVIVAQIAILVQWFCPGARFLLSWLY